MRTLSEFEQEDRKRKLLQAVIHEYIKTGKPVGSASLADHYKLGVSPATLRNVMSELEEEGFLSHPHTSAGRVPTDKAYRHYVDSLVDLQRLAQMEEQRIRQEYEARVREIEGLMLSASKTLSALSRFTGFVLAPGMDQTRLQHVELIPLDARRVLAILVSDTGQVKHRAVAFQRPFPLEHLPALSRLLNERLRGRPFSEARDSLLQHIEEFGQRQREMAELARLITQQAFDLSEEGDLYLEGASNILSLPDFQSQEQMLSLAHFMDERRALGELISRDLEEAAPAGRFPGVRVRIGSENQSPDLRDLSLVSSTYTVNGRTAGVLGIIGPKRMEYSRMIGLVDYVSRMVSGVLKRLAGG